MTSQNHNPFVLPGFGQSGDMAKNPIMASMEMMRQAWEGLAATSGLEPSAMATPMSIEDLDRRIADLRAVENWLRLNLSMLSSTIQGLEVQRSTIATLKSFMSTAAPAGQQTQGRSPLDEALGLHPQAGAPSDKPKESTGDKTADDAEPAADSGSPAAAQAAMAAEGWWDMLQKQFDTLAAATTATLQGAEAMANAGQAAARPAAKQSKKTAGEPTGKAASRTPRKAARKSSATAEGKRSAAKKPAARKRSPGTRAGSK